MKISWMSSLFGGLLSFAAMTSYADTDLKIEGLDGDLEDNVSAYLSSIKEEEYSVSLRFQSRVEENITDALKALGYYNPTMTFSVDGDTNEPSADTTLIVKVDIGEPTIIYESDIVIEGDAATDIDFLNLLDRSKLNLGQIVNHGHYESLKTSIRNLALQKGYFDGEFTDTRLQISPQRNQAFVHLHYKSGERYMFGATSIIGSQIEKERVQSLVPYKAGDYYQSTTLGLLNQNLSSSEWFSSVSVEPDL